MSTARLFRDLAPYLVVLVAAAYLYHLADSFEFQAMPDRLGPDAWPKLILGLIVIVCLYEFGRRVIVAMIQRPVEATRHSDEETREQTHTGAVWIVVAATVVYLLTFEIVGFFLAMVIFVFILMYAGGYRRLAVMLPLSAAITLFFMYVFMKIIFVALPLGIEPFSLLSIALMRLLGIH
jgi:putative tricarboxylic transport membrane protein